MKEIISSFEERQFSKIAEKIKKQLRKDHTRIAKVLRREGFKHNLLDPVAFFYDAYGEHVDIEEALDLVYHTIDIGRFDLFKHLLVNSPIQFLDTNIKDIMNMCLKYKKPKFADFLLNNNLYICSDKERKKKQLAIKLLEVTND